MAHKTTELKFNQWEAVDLWLSGIRSWADSDLRLHLWVSDNGDKRAQPCGGSSPRRPLTPRHPEEEELQGCKQTFNGQSNFAVRVW